MRQKSIQTHFDNIAENYDYYKTKNSFYYKNLKKLLRKHIPGNKSVFEIGCGTGDLLNNLVPGMGYGYDISPKMISIAVNKHADSLNLIFSTKWPKTKFDYIFMSDVIEHLDKPKETFVKAKTNMNKNTKFIITMANPIWEPILMLAEKLKLKMPEGPHKRAKTEDIRLWIKESGLEIQEHSYTLLVPIRIPVLTDFANKYLIKLFEPLAFIEYFVITLK